MTLFDEDHFPSKWFGMIEQITKMVGELEDTDELNLKKE